jgi:hypothetical protein
VPAPKPPEFRQRAVELARRRDKPIAQVAKDLQISESCLRRWMDQADVAWPPDPIWSPHWPTRLEPVSPTPTLPNGQPNAGARSPLTSSGRCRCGGPRCRSARMTGVPPAPCNCTRPPGPGSGTSTARWLATCPRRCRNGAGCSTRSSPA